MNTVMDVQRRRLLQGMAAGAMLTLLPAAHAVAGVIAARLPAGRSVYRVKGKAWVNGERVNGNTRIGPGDTVKTGRDSELVFAVGDHGMLLRGGSHLGIEPKDSNDLASLLIGGLRLFSGKLLSVSRNKGMRIETPSATIGIRGTGVYLEAGPDRTYFCTCYGDVDVATMHDGACRESVHSAHHDRPLYIHGPGRQGPCMHDANGLARPNHSDEELMLLEALVGRKPPFA